MSNTVVCDLDGTLCDVEWRRHFVTGKKRDYAAFHAGISKDNVNHWCRELLWSMREYGNRIVLVSARPTSAKAKTMEWLGANDIPFDECYILRPDGDSTPDQELKRAWLKRYGKERILFVVDDRAKVAKMWREEGLVCLHCADWPEKKTPEMYISSAPEPSYTAAEVERAMKWAGLGGLARGPVLDRLWSHGKNAGAKKVSSVPASLFDHMDGNGRPLLP